MVAVLVVEDEASIRDFLEILLRRMKHAPMFAKTAPDGVSMLGQKTFDLVLSDLRLPGGSGFDVLAAARAVPQPPAVIMMTAFATTETAVEAMKAGAYDYIIKPFKVDELQVVIERAIEHRQLQTENRELKATLDARAAPHRMLGTSEAMREVFALIDKVAQTRTTVLIGGESGTGKELVARAIHGRGQRAREAFVPINCGAIPDTLIESELFGHSKGAFTGAVSDKPGLFERADGGTVFLDEIGELPLPMQVKLLRVLQERKVQRVGSQKELEVDCRIIAATNRHLDVEVQQGRFREDLYFRLNVIELRLPPLRDRKADVPLMAEAFLAKFAEQQGVSAQRFSDAALRALVEHNWPGNVRELENVVERAVTLSTGTLIDVDLLPPSVRKPTRTTSSAEGVAVPKAAEIPAALGSLDDFPEDGIQLETLLEGLEKRYLERALQRTGGRKKKAAQLLGLSFRSFRYRVAKLGLAVSDDDDEG
jgi:two-component system, NtrC family, response regulator PilR